MPQVTTERKVKFKKGDLIILNETDAPIATNVVEVTRVKRNGKYSARYLAHKYKLKDNLTLSEAIIVPAFGVDVIRGSDFLFVCFNKNMQDTATYKDGKKRRWQETLPKKVSLIRGKSKTANHGANQ